LTVDNLGLTHGVNYAIPLSDKLKPLCCPCSA